MLIDKILPSFDVNNPILLHAKKINDACEAYSRYAISQVILPVKIANQYNRLVKAITNIPKSPFVDKQEIIREYPELQVHINSLDHCLKYYPDVLSGIMHYVDILFPEGDIDLNKEAYYSLESDYFNQLLSQIVKNYFEITNNKLRVMEVGAGMGTSTRYTLPKLEGHEYEYYFTDIGSAFISRAQKVFSNYPQVTFKTYNVETNPSLEFGKFDIVIGVNVLHATSDILNTLKNIRTLVKKDGLLILHEMVAKSDFATLTAGITTGWWMYKDTWRIEDSPLISIENWYKILKESGFTEVKSLGNTDRSIIIAS